MEKKVVMDIGLAFKPEKFKELVESSIYAIDFIGLQVNIDVLQKTINNKKINYFNYSKVYSFDDYDIKNQSENDLLDIINKVSWDKNTIDIWERCHAPAVFNYSMKSENSIISMIVSAFKFLIVEKPVYLLFFECPHSIESWTIAKVAENMGIPVRYCRNAMFHWRNVLLEGMNKHPKFFSDPEINHKPTQDEVDYFCQVEQNYQIGTEAIKPEFLEVMKERKQKKLFSFWTDLKQNWKRPYISFYKNACYKAYEKVSKEFNPNVGKYIVFFMHLQPERTTLPEGYGFCNHYKALKVLSELVPDDYTIYVKEHPANFYTKCSPCGRWPSFYTEIAKIKKVVFVPLEIDPYYMIGGCQCVSTITGTIAREALMMGKPVINFGLNTLYTELPYGMYNYVNTSSLKDFIDKFSAMDPKKIKQSFHDLMVNKVLSEGINGFPNIKEWKNSGTCIVLANEASRYEIFKFILSK